MLRRPSRMFEHVQQGSCIPHLQLHCILCNGCFELLLLLLWHSLCHSYFWSRSSNDCRHILIWLRAPRRGCQIFWLFCQQTLNYGVSVVFYFILRLLHFKGVAQFISKSLLSHSTPFACGYLAFLILLQKFFELCDFILILFKQGIFRIFVHCRLILNVLCSASISQCW